MDASKVTYAPEDVSKWSTKPTEVDAALDALAESGLVSGAWTDNAVLRGDGTTAIQGSSVTIDDSGNLAVPGSAGPAGSRIYLDGGGGGGDTFFVESLANQIDVVTGGEIIMVFDGSTATKLTQINDNFLVNGESTFGQVSDHQGGITLNTVGAHDTMMAPKGFHAGNITDVTAWANQEILFLYLGRIWKPITTATICVNVTTAWTSAGLSPHAEIGIFSGAFVRAGSTLERRGYTDVSAIYNATGLFQTAVTLTGVTAGMELWAGFSQRTTGTLFQCRAYLADNIASGVLNSSSPGKVSTWTGTATVSATVAAPWCAVIV